MKSKIEGNENNIANKGSSILYESDENIIINHITEIHFHFNNVNESSQLYYDMSKQAKEIKQQIAESQERSQDSHREEDLKNMKVMYEEIKRLRKLVKEKD